MRSTEFKFEENDEGHLNRLTSFLSNYLVTVWARCFDSLSCCMTHSESKFKFFTDLNNFFCKLSRQISTFILLSIKTKFPTPKEDKQLHFYRRTSQLGPYVWDHVSLPTRKTINWLSDPNK